MNRPKLVLMTVGALLVQKLSEDEKSSWEKIKDQNLLAIREGQVKGQTVLEEKILRRLKALDLQTEAGLQEASPEIKSLAKIGVGKGDQIVLYASETPDGILTARIVREFARQIWGCQAAMEVIVGLQVEDAGRFRSQGVVRYVQNLVKEVSNPNQRYGREIILNATAGYKSLVPYTTLVGLLFQVPVVYIFEWSSELISLPPLPLDFDQTFFKEVEPLLQRIDQESAISGDELKNIPAEIRDKLLPLLEPVDGQYTLSALGLVVYERYKAPPPLLKSTRQPADKDHTRDFSQETHRSSAFEKFKQKLAECPWVEDFWYLKGTDESKNDVQQVGEELHVTYGGIVLRVKTTATHPSHYESIIADIRQLMR